MYDKQAIIDYSLKIIIQKRKCFYIARACEFLEFIKNNLTSDKTRSSPGDLETICIFDL